MKEKTITSFFGNDTNEFLDGNYFSQSYTLDPTLATNAWGRLSEDTFQLYITSLPTILHSSLVKTIKERNVGRDKTKNTTKRRNGNSTSSQGRRSIAA